MVALKPALLVLFAIGNEALAVTSDILCTSKLGTASIASSKIPRATTTIKSQVTVIKRVIRKANVIVVPQPRTTTETETAKRTITTDAAPEVEIATSVVTSMQTQKIISYTTTTSTSTSYTTTTKWTTKTVAAPADFKFLHSYDSQWVPKKLKVRKNQDASPVIQPNSLYVQRVDCTKRVPSTIIKTVTTTVPGPRRTLAPKTKTKMTTTTEISTQTNYPPKVTQTTIETVSPITVVRETVTRQAASVSTEIVTVETLLPAPDFYEACGQDAFVSSANGGNGIVLSPNLSSQTEGITGEAAKGAYNCCVECMKRPNCLLSKVSGDGTCFHHVSYATPNVCPNGQTMWSYYYSYPNSAAVYTFTNGPCGRMENMGLQ
ncbi:hypothetical protein FVEN_g4355 [Fusarium venenatum]|uniref:Apple domain-containing protein n=1 Tax=Fusarium venenatum TaxID=56646 RepID=A0A2L2TL57_9HYPO|nr:uncharacterized protein FVRRES_02763 [Fusarium venenatum]KAG8357872.1 hypothetical protein FVEN_g4355 [Fusarium venenatum]KAH7004157.1 hypothetical protein EDB82DRAFT_520184 [Fusarium venenatum]CEI66251.1 unnamed protein product [Fusarium venenatum]